MGLPELVTLFRLVSSSLFQPVGLFSGETFVLKEN